MKVSTGLLDTGASSSKVKVKVDIYSSDISVGSADFTSIIARYLNSVSSPSGEYRAFSTAEAIHTIYVPPGTHYCWVAKVGVDSKFTQRFYT